MESRQGAYTLLHTRAQEKYVPGRHMYVPDGLLGLCGAEGVAPFLDDAQGGLVG